MKTHAMTDIGLSRSENQDCFYTSELPVGHLPNLFIVADGMGGHVGGRFASHKAIESAVEYVKGSDQTEIEKVLRGALKKANEAVLEEAKAQDMEGMGTTFVAAVVEGETLHVVNVGDSRLYIATPGYLKQITTDHSLVEEMVRLGKIAPSAARTHEKKNVITRAVGAAPTVDEDYFKVSLPEEWQILICTDGLTNMVLDEEIHRILLSKRDVIEEAEQLVETAKANGGSDNITVAVLKP